MSAKSDRTLDALGLYCPIPVFMTRQEMDKMSQGEILEVLADDPAAEEDIIRWAKKAGQEIINLEKEGHQLRFLIRKVK